MKRRALSLIIAALLAFVFMVSPGIIKTFQAMMIYGTGDPQIIAGGISEAIVNSAFVMVLVLPLLVLFQWFMRRRKQYKTKFEDSEQFE